MSNRLTVAAMKGSDKSEGPVTTPAARINWKVDQLKSSYVNFASANSTKEEVVINFGMNNSWDRTGPDLEVDLQHRIVMSPFAARRLAELLTRLMSEYESRHGPLK